MTFGIIPHRKYPGRQNSGIWATHSLMSNDFRSLCVPVLPITLPMLIEYNNIRKEFPLGSQKPLRRRNTALFVYRHTPQSVNEFRPPILDEYGKPYSSVAYVFDALRGLLDHLPDDPTECKSIDQILLDGYIRWPAYSVIHDMVHELPYSHYSDFKKWIFTELVGLGFGDVAVQKSSHKRGRPGRTFVPNEWGRRFVELISRDSRLEVTDDMRRTARHRKLLSYNDRLIEIQRQVQEYQDSDVQVPMKLLERLDSLNRMYNN